MKRKVFMPSEVELNEEADRSPHRLLSATWIEGTGPRGGKVHIGQARYDALNLLAIQDKAVVVARFSAEPLYSKLTITGIVVRFPKLRKKDVQISAAKKP